MFNQVIGNAWGVVEYLPNSHRLLALRDAEGTLLHADPRYVTT
jgi:hypothetical protein